MVVTSAPEFDLVVVGGGIVGITLALTALEQDPEMRVLLVEAQWVGSGTTARTAGLLTPVARPGMHQMVERSLATYSRWLRECPSLPLVDVPVAWVVPEGRREHFLAAFIGPPPRLADGSEASSLRSSYPRLRLADDELVYLGAAAGWRADGSGLARELASMYLARGGVCHEGTRVDGVDARQDGVAVRLEDGRILGTRVVACCTGPWMVGGIGAGEAQEQGTRVKKVAALHFADRPAPGSPAVIFWDDDAFFLPFPERGYTLLSFFCDEWDCLPEAGSLALTAKDREQGVGYALRRNPDLVDCYSGGRTFCDAYPRNATPFVARNGSGRVLAVGGCSGSGIRIAPALAGAAVGDVRKLLACVP